MSDPSKSPEGPDPSKPRCTARTARGACRRWPVAGATVCATHGGSARQVKAAAGRRLAAAEWSRTFGEPAAEADPAETVLQEIRYTAGHVAWLRDRVQETDPEALVWGVESQTTRGSGEFPGVDVTHAAKASTWLVLYQQERDRLLRQCEIAHRMGIEERHVELAERLGGLVADLLRNVLDDLQLTDAQQLLAAEAMPRRLRAVTAQLAGVA